LVISSSGILNINKPSGCTSFQVVRHIRSLLGASKVGHCGTLDPLASGVLIVVFGDATRQAESLMGQEKVYKADMILGIRTDSGDVTGRTIEQSQVPFFSREKIEKAFLKFMGPQRQVPPIVSAIKYQGTRLYKLARAGIEAPRPPRDIEIHSLDILDIQPAQISFRVRCSKGTYVRSLAEDIGRELGVPATLKSLVRERSGDFRVEDALTWQEISSMSREELLGKSRSAEAACVPS
jgi:tRNA pseudouridine55 synthase